LPVVTTPGAGALVFDQGAADWIRDVVLPTVYPRRKGCKASDDDNIAYQLLRICPCEYGRCGHCSQRDVHTDCTKHRLAPNPTAAASVLARSREGWFPVAAVWVVGRACRWVCDCPCRPDGTMPGTAPRPRQGDLFEELGVTL